MKHTYLARLDQDRSLGIERTADASLRVVDVQTGDFQKDLNGMYSADGYLFFVTDGVPMERCFLNVAFAH
ncbi:MAG: hypothetical protein IJ133_02935 [Clostridia bacterium]|nr:hypothetical protein [Clostridia bacterium]